MQRDVIIAGSFDYFAKREREGYTTKLNVPMLKRRGFTPIEIVAQHHSVAIST